MSLCSLLVCAAMATAAWAGQPSSSFTVTTFNARLNPTLPRYSSHRQSIAKMLSNHTTDVLCLQEVWFYKDILLLSQALAARLPYVFSFPTYESSAPCMSLKDILKIIQLQKYVWHCKGMSPLACFLNTRFFSKLSQQCRTCLMVASPDIYKNFQNCTFHFKPINLYGLIIFSKYPLENTLSVGYEPDQPALIPRGYISATIPNIGRVTCTQLTANEDTLGLSPSYESYAEKNLAEVTKLNGAVTWPDAILAGSLGFSPIIRGRRVSGQMLDSYFALMRSKWYLPYVETVGRCTVCKRNPLVPPGRNSTISDHVAVKKTDFTVSRATRVFDDLSSGEVSDHYGVEVTMQQVL